MTQKEVSVDLGGDEQKVGEFSHKVLTSSMMVQEVCQKGQGRGLEQEGEVRRGRDVTNTLLLCLESDCQNLQDQDCFTERLSVTREIP